jgi:hypothetical protein
MIPWALIGKFLLSNRKIVIAVIGLICLIGLIAVQHHQIGKLTAALDKERTKVLLGQVVNKQLMTSIKVQNDAIAQWQAEGEKQKERVKETSRRISELSAAYQKEIDALKNSSVIVQEITLPCNVMRKDGSQWMQEEWRKLFLQ